MKTRHMKQIKKAGVEAQARSAEEARPELLPLPQAQNHPHPGQQRRNPAGRSIARTAAAAELATP